MMVVTALAIVRTAHLFAVVMLAGVFSLLSALLFVTMDAVDVAFTEAAVGAGISTVLMLGTLALTSRHERRSTLSPVIPLFVVFVTGAFLYLQMDKALNDVQPAIARPNLLPKVARFVACHVSMLNRIAFST